MQHIIGRYWRFLWIILGALALASCQSIIPGGKGPAPGTQPSQPDTTQPTPDDRPVTDQLPQDTERHRIALLLPMSGQHAAVGNSIANAITLAQLDTGADNIRITRYDTARGAEAAVQKAMADGNKLILGPLLSDNVATISQIANGYNVPVISFSNDVRVAGGNVWLLGYMPEDSISRMLSYAKGQGISQIAGMVPVGDYGERASNALLNSARQYGVTVVSLQSFQRGGNSLQDVINKMDRDSPAQAVMIADNGANAIRAVPMIRRSNANGNARILGTELWNIDNDLSQDSAMRGAWFASVSDNYYRTFIGKYREQFGANPFRLSTLGYDAVLLVTRVTRNWQPGTVFPIAQLRDQGGFVGLDGAFRFNRQNIAERLLEVKQIDNGTINVISPAPQSFGN